MTDPAQAAQGKVVGTIDPMESSIDKRVAVIIEDDDDIRNLLEAVLTQAGFDVVATANGPDGIEAVRTHDPIVTTLDVNMPGMDGFETARRLRAFSTTYIVMLTALSEEIDTLQGLDAGADDYINKPFRPRELRARIEAMLRRPRAVEAQGRDDALGEGRSVLHRSQNGARVKLDHSVSPR